MMGGWGEGSVRTQVNKWLSPPPFFSDLFTKFTLFQSPVRSARRADHDTDSLRLFGTCCKLSIAPCLGSFSVLRPGRRRCTFLEAPVSALAATLRFACQQDWAKGRKLMDSRAAALRTRNLGLGVPESFQTTEPSGQWE